MSSPVVRYKLNVMLGITKEIAHDVNGRELQSGQPIPDNAYWRSDGMNERLSINEELNLGSLNFADAMRVLVQLHDTLTAMRKDA